MYLFIAFIGSFLYSLSMNEDAFEIVSSSFLLFFNRMLICLSLYFRIASQIERIIGLWHEGLI